MFDNFRSIFNTFGNLYYRNICHWLRCKSAYKLHSTVNNECLVDTRGSGFSLKTASVIGLLFGSFHLALIRSSDEQQNPDIVCTEESNTKITYQCFEAVGQFPEVLGNYKDSYVARVLKTTVERSLISLIKSATAKVKLALGNYYSDYQLLHGSDHTASSIEVIAERKERERNVVLNDLVKNADARREINKIFRVVNIGREEKEIQDHPLLTIAESTAHYLMRQMDSIEA
ncbi:MICOS complex subunit [Dirofilaria immitis]